MIRHNSHDNSSRMRQPKGVLFLLPALLFMLASLCARVAPAAAAPGDYLGQWGMTYHFFVPPDFSTTGVNGPYGVAIDPAGRVHVVDSGHGLVKLYTDKGTYLGRIGDSPLPEGMGWPRGIALDDAGNVYVADTFEHNVKVYSSSGAYLRTIGTRGGVEPGSLAYPEDVEVHAGHLYVAHGDWVEVFGTDGSFVRRIGGFGSGNGQLWGAAGLAVDSIGQLYVADTLNGRISVFTSTGAFVREIGSPGSAGGELNRPLGVALDKGELFVVDSYNHRISVFTEQGLYLRSFGTEGRGAGELLYPKGVAVAADGRVYVGDSMNGRVMIFSRTGQFLSEWASRGSGKGEFHLPHGLALDRSGRVVVSDLNNRIQAFSGSGQFLWSAGSGPDGELQQPRGVTINQAGTIFVTDSYSSRIAVYGSQGNLLRYIGVDVASPTDSALDAAGNIYIPNRMNDRVDVFNQAGELLRSIVTGGVGEGEHAPPVAVTFDRNNNLYVLEEYSGRILLFNSAGGFLRTLWSNIADGETLKSPNDVAVDGSGNVYVADTYNNRIVVLSSTGTFRGSFGRQGDHSGEFRFPRSLDVDPMGTRVYVADTYNNRIQFFTGYGATGFVVSTPPSGTAGQPLQITVRAVDAGGGPVPGYSGRVHFTSSDPAATLPADAQLVNGIGTFTVILRSTGRITITDTVTPSITGSSQSIAITAVPDLAISKTHNGNFVAGQRAGYSITVANRGTGPTVGMVQVVDRLPHGLSRVAMSGRGWSCRQSTLTCTRSDTLAAGSSYPPVTVVVDVSRKAPVSVTNQATVSGGGENNVANNTASDATRIGRGAPWRVHGPRWR